MINLQNIFIGFIQNYRSLNLRFGPKYETMSYWTAAEIGWFARLGESLGFQSVIEKGVVQRGRPVDLAWVNPFTSAVVLHLERENNPAKINDTITRKLLPKNKACAQYCVGIFDELDRKHLKRIESLTIRAFNDNKCCIEALMICYSHIPSTKHATQKRTRRYKLEWPVRGFHLTNDGEWRWLEARCTTDCNNMYTMYLTNPAIPSPYSKNRYWKPKEEQLLRRQNNLKRRKSTL